MSEFGYHLATETQLGVAHTDDFGATASTGWLNALSTNEFSDPRELVRRQDEFRRLRDGAAVTLADFFWRPEKRDFFQHSEQVTMSPTRYCPTCTFVSVAAIEEANAYFPLESMAERSRKARQCSYSYLEFLQGIKKETIEKAMGGSSLNYKGEKRNPYTASWLLRTFMACRQMLIPLVDQSETTMTMYEYVNNSILDLSTYLANCMQPLLGEGAVRVGHPFLPYLCYRSLVSAECAKADVAKLLRTPQMNTAVMEFAERECYRLLGMQAVGAWAPVGLMALINGAGLLSLCDPRKYHRLILHSLEVVCDSQMRNGTWPLYRLPFHSKPVGPLEVSSFELGAHLSEIATRTIVASSAPQAKSRSALIELGLSALVDSLQQSCNFTETPDPDGKKVIVRCEWGQEHLPDSRVGESWVTAFAIMLLTGVERYFAEVARQQVLNKYAAESIPMLSSAVAWSDVAYEDKDDKYSAYIHQKFIAPYNSVVDGRSGLDGALVPHKSKLNVSMLLFGPPGTSKTTVVRAMARELKWPLVVLTPGAFLNEGQHAIDKRAAEVFGDMLLLDRVVILFDECDELFRVRPNDQGGIGNGDISSAALITGAMLPRLQQLHDRGRLIFVLATNRLGMIDPAVRREGRFDHLIGLGPPGDQARVFLIEKWCTDLIPDDGPDRDKIIGKLAASLNGCTRSEIKKFVDAMRNVLIQNKQKLITNITQADAVQERLQAYLDGGSRAIDAAAMARFDEHRRKYCAVRRDRRHTVQNGEKD